MTSNGHTIESCLSLEVEVDHEGQTRALTSVQECLEYHFDIWETMLDSDAPYVLNSAIIMLPKLYKTTIIITTNCNECLT